MLLIITIILNLIITDKKFYELDNNREDKIEERDDK